jgi:hypothetical protein
LNDLGWTIGFSKVPYRYWNTAVFSSDYPHNNGSRAQCKHVARRSRRYTRQTSISSEFPNPETKNFWNLHGAQFFNIYCGLIPAPVLLVIALYRLTGWQ